MQELFSHISLNTLNLRIEPPKLPNNDVHLWLVELDQLPINEMANLLSANEQSRADNFHFMQDRNRFIASHGLLRVILAFYLHLEPAQIDFSFSEHGKPYINKSFNKDNLTFNMSHSNNLVLYAIALGRKIGIDVEFIRHIEDINQIAEIFLSKRERTKLSKLRGEQKQEEFFRYWTLREAYVKAIDENLPLSPEFYLETFVPMADYIATIAVEGNKPNFRYFRVMAD